MTKRVNESELELLKDYLIDCVENGKSVNASIILRVILCLVDELASAYREIKALRNDRTTLA